MDALVDGGVMKRIDLAINDHTGILDIPELEELLHAFDTRPPVQRNEVE